MYVSCPRRLALGSHVRSWRQRVFLVLDVDVAAPTTGGCGPDVPVRGVEVKEVGEGNTDLFEGSGAPQRYCYLEIQEPGTHAKKRLKTEDAVVGQGRPARKKK